MESLLQGVSGIVTVVIIIMVGFVLSRLGWFDEKSTFLISKIVINVSLPPYMMANLLNNFSKEQLLEMSRGLPVPFLTMLVSFLVGKVAIVVLKIPKGRRGVFLSAFFLSNVIFIGLPLNTALFGEASIPYVMVYYMVNTVLFWTVGVHCIAVDGDTAEPIFSIATIKAVLSPPLLGFIFGIFFILMGWNLPKPVMNAFKYIGNLTTPLAMFFIGIAISKTSLSEVSFDKALWGAIAGRYLVSPMAVLMILPYFALPTLMGNVFVMQASMPIMTNTAILARRYGADYKYAAMITVVSTLLAAVVIPFYVWVIGR